MKSSAPLPPLTAPGKGHSLLPFLTVPLYVTGMAGTIHFLSDVLVPETSRFPAFELGSSQMEKKVQKDY